MLKSAFRSLGNWPAELYFSNGLLLLAQYSWDNFPMLLVTPIFGHPSLPYMGPISQFYPGCQRVFRFVAFFRSLFLLLVPCNKQLKNLDRSVVTGKSQTSAYRIDLAIARLIRQGLSFRSSRNDRKRKIIQVEVVNLHPAMRAFTDSFMHRLKPRTKLHIASAVQTKKNISISHLWSDHLLVYVRFGDVRRCPPQAFALARTLSSLSNGGRSL